jgi:UMF1 family MFS transporter
MTGLLRRLGLHTRELRAWALYDWGNSAYFTVVVTAVFPIYFQDVAASQLEPARATAVFSWITAFALITIALVSPMLGAMADFRGARKRFLSVSLSLGVLSAAGLYFVRDGDLVLASVLFVVGNAAVLLSLVFYDSLLPHLAKPEEIDRVSAAGYALGYLGGGLLLVVNLALYLMPERFGLPDAQTGIRVGFVLVAIWWLLFSLPLFLRVPEPVRALEADETGVEPGFAIALTRLRETLTELRGYKQAFLLLLAILVYNDGISTIYRLATIYGREIGIPQTDLITAILLVQFVGVPFAFLFGLLASAIGTKRAILAGLVIYLGISGFGYFVKSVSHFYALAICVAMVQGGVQALSRSLFASMVPVHKSSEFFGFFGVADRFSAVLGPLVFAAVTSLTGTSRLAVVSIMAFFLVGAMLLLRVDVAAGQARARELARTLHRATP